MYRLWWPEVSRCGSWVAKISPLAKKEALCDDPEAWRAFVRRPGNHQESGVMITMQWVDFRDGWRAAKRTSPGTARASTRGSSTSK